MKRREKHELQPIGGQRPGILQESEQSNLQSKQRMPESGETVHVGKQASNFRRRNDKDDPGKASERRPT